MAIPAILNDAGALAALIGLGLPEQLAEAMLAHWKAEKAAKLVDVFGVRKTHAQATVLREKVAATREQVVKKLMPEAAAKSALQSYGIPEPTINALVALWAAQALKQVLPP